MDSFTETVDLSKERVCITIPAYSGKVEVDATASLLLAGQWFTAQQCDWAFAGMKGCSLVTKARNTIVAKFLSHPNKYSILVMIDDDIVFMPEDLQRLVWWAASGKDVVAGFYRQKKLDVEYRTDLVNRDDRPVFTEGGRLLEVERIGTGFMAIRREVLEHLIESNPNLYYVDKNEDPAYALFDTKLEAKGYIGEDYAFCDLARRHGFRVWGDPYCHLTHVGRFEFSGSLSDGFFKADHAVDSERRETPQQGSLFREAA